MLSDKLKQNITQFKRKYYTNELIRGTLISTLLFGSILLIFSLLEGFFWFDQPIRLVLFGLLSMLLLYCIVFKIAIPILRLTRLKQGISDEEAARLIGQHFPDIEDKLLNYLQLSSLNKSETSLMAAAIAQKQDHLKVFAFREAINFKVNKTYAVYAGSLVLFLLLVSFISPELFSDSSSRIVQFNKRFERPAPFSFEVTSDLTAFKGDSYELSVELNGDALPEQVYLQDQHQNFRMNRVDAAHYTFTFPNLDQDKKLKFEGAGFLSHTYDLKVYNRPEMRNLSIDIDYPSYTGLTDESYKNTGSVIVPEGSVVSWNLESSDADKAFFVIERDSIALDNSKNGFSKELTIRNSFLYEIKMANEYARNKSKIIYEVSVIKDESPILEVAYVPDTVSFKSVILSGNIGDDYGFSGLSLSFKKSGSKAFQTIRMPLDKSQINQQFFFQWDLDTINIKENEYLELFMSVSDNDAVNGYKTTSSERFYLKMPDKSEIESIISNKSKQSENKLDKTESLAEELNDRLDDLEDRLRNKKDLDWQDEKLIEDIITDKEKLSKEIEDLARKHQELLDSQNEFKKQSKNLQEKSKQLQQLIEEVLDEDTKKLYDELQKLLKEKSNSDQVLEQMSKIRSKEQNMEKELERALELFKRLKFETGLEQTAEKLNELGKKQEELGIKTQTEEALNQAEKDKNTSESGEENEETQKKSSQEEEQENIQEEFDQIQNELDRLNELNQELKNPEPMEEFDKEEQEIQEKLDEIPQELKNKEMNKAGQKMKNAGQKMQKMSKSMQQMQSGMEMTMMQENLDHLRDILDNLIKLSFEQELIIDEIKGVQQVDPRFIELSQEQLKLINNAQVIEDSLLSLASRVAQISSFVTREVGEINENLDRTMSELRERNKGKAASYQQFAMTSMNNLALLLDDVLEQMQMSLAESMGKPQKGGNQKQSLPNMSDMQQQLSEKIEELKGSGKSGRQLSEELAKLAAEQAELRRQLEEMQKQLEGQKVLDENGDGSGNQAGDKLKEAIQQMEENEIDLVNKRLTNRLIERQQDIITRMLEAEESLREQKESPEREGETAKTQQRKLPPAIEEYLKAKKQEIELLKTIPLDLNPFYKKEVNDYFRRLSGDEL
ncbi:MAG: DUF4175 family protein [Marinoscillum sp.]